GQPQQTPRDPKFAGAPFERIGPRGLEAAPAVRLLARTADVHLRAPLLPDPQPQPAQDRVVRQELVVVLPVFEPEDVVEPVHDGPVVHVREREGPVPFDWSRFVFHLGFSVPCHVRSLEVSYGYGWGAMA